jgi:hypothetical protein
MSRKMMEGRLFKVMKTKQWIDKTKDSGQRRLVVEEAKVHPGL